MLQMLQMFKLVVAAALATTTMAAFVPNSGADLLELELGRRGRQAVSTTTAEPTTPAPENTAAPNSIVFTFGATVATWTPVELAAISETVTAAILEADSGLAASDFRLFFDAQTGVVTALFTTGAETSAASAAFGEILEFDLGSGTAIAVKVDESFVEVAGADVAGRLDSPPVGVPVLPFCTEAKAAGKGGKKKKGKSKAGQDSEQEQRESGSGLSSDDDPTAEAKAPAAGEAPATPGDETSGSGALAREDGNVPTSAKNSKKNSKSLGKSKRDRRHKKEAVFGPAALGKEANSTSTDVGLRESETGGNTQGRETKTGKKEKKTVKESETGGNTQERETKTGKKGDGATAPESREGGCVERTAASGGMHAGAAPAAQVAFFSGVAMVVMVGVAVGAALRARRTTEYTLDESSPLIVETA